MKFSIEKSDEAKGDAIPGASRLRNQNEILIEKSDEAKRSNPSRESFLKKKMKRLSTKKF